MVETVASAAKQRLAGLDALRGYAAIAVLLFHARRLVGAGWLMPSGYQAVDLFFVLSGLVIAHSYETRIGDRGLLWFLRIRIVRLYPLFALGMICGLTWIAALMIRGAHLPGIGPALVANALYLPAPAAATVDNISPIDGPAWSLFLEFWINLAYAATLPLLSTRVLSVIVGGFAAVLFVSALRLGSLDGGAHWSSLGVGIARTCFAFPLGVLLYRLRSRLPDLKTVSPFAGLGLIAIFSLPGSAIHDLLFVLVGAPLLTVVALGGAPRLAALFGERASYALYTIHFPLLSLTDGAAHVLGVDVRLATWVLLAALLLTCPLLDTYFDRPIRRFFGATSKEAAHQGAAP